MILRRKRAKIDYWHKKVWFSLKKGDQFELSERLIRSTIFNPIKARKM